MQREKHNRLLITSVFVALSMLSCASGNSNIASSKIPSIYLNPDKAYPQDVYLVASGSGDSLQDAQQNALASLARLIKVEVQSSLVLSSSEKNTETTEESSYEISTTLDNRINSSSDQKLIGVQYGDSYQAKDGFVYTIAYIERLKVGNIYRENIATKNTEIERLVQDANQTTGFSKYALLSKAWELSQQNDGKISQLQIIAPEMARAVTTNRRMSSTTLEQERNRTARGIEVDINTMVLGGDETVQSKIENNVIDLFTALQFSVRTGEDSSSGENNVVVNTEVNWEEETEGKYPMIVWTLSMAIEENGTTIVSNTQTGRSKGKTIDFAHTFAFQDIRKAIHKNTRNAILSQLQ